MSSNSAITAIKNYIELLKEESKRDNESKKNFERFVSQNDPEGLISLGRSLLVLKQKIEIRDNFIYNIENSLKLEVETS